MSFPKVLLVTAIVLFGAIGLMAVFKNKKASDVAGAPVAEQAYIEDSEKVSLLVKILLGWLSVIIKRLIQILDTVSAIICLTCLE